MLKKIRRTNLLCGEIFFCEKLSLRGLGLFLASYSSAALRGGQATETRVINRTTNVRKCWTEIFLKKIGAGICRDDGRVHWSARETHRRMGLTAGAEATWVIVGVAVVGVGWLVMVRQSPSWVSHRIG